jgi:hypothetical protein
MRPTNGDERIDPGHFDEEGPVLFVYSFLNAVLRDDPPPSYDEGWLHLSPLMRICRAQAWIWNNRDDPAIDGELQDRLEHLATGPHRGDPLWDDFSAIELRQLREAWGDKYARQLGAASRTRVVGPDLELVVLVPTDGTPIEVHEPTLVTDALLFLVERGDNRWYIASYGDALPEPGWPPTFDPMHG